MKNVPIIGGVILFIILLSGVLSWYSLDKTATMHENALEAKYANNQNEMASYNDKVSQLVQVAKFSVDAQQKLMKLANESRYGINGNSVAQLINENNIPMDMNTVNQLTLIISSERDRFRNAQTEITDMVNQYKNLWASPINRLLLSGHKQVDLKKYDLVIDSRTEKAFETKRAEPLNLNLN